GTELPDHRAVDADAPGTDQLLGAAPRRHAERAQDLLQPVAQPSRPSSTAGSAPDRASPSLGWSAPAAASARATSASAPSPSSPTGGSACRSGRSKTSRNSFVVP